MYVSVEKLIEMGVMRESMFGSGDWYVIQTEDGPKDVSLAEITADQMSVVACKIDLSKEKEN